MVQYMHKKYLLKTKTMKTLSFEYLFGTSSKILYQRLSTASGLNEWFADNVAINNDIMTFSWGKSEQKAKIKRQKNNLYVKFQWLDNPERYTEFKIEKNNLTEDLTLLITDVIDEEEDEEFITNIWNDSIKKLKSRLGLKTN